MIKYLFSPFAIVLSVVLTQVQKPNFSGTWDNPELEMISGIQYSNAVPNKIVVIQTKDSIKLESVSAGTEGDVTNTTTIALNGKPVTRISKTSKRTIKTTASWSNNGKTFAIVTLYSYADNPGKTEYTNTEVWELTADGNLKIVKTSDADVTDDWSIKATYRKAGS